MGLKKIFKKVSKPLAMVANPVSAASGVLGKKLSGQNPLSLAMIGANPIVGGQALLGMKAAGNFMDGGQIPDSGGGASTDRRSLSEILKDPSFNYSDAPVGPAYEDNSAAYQAALQSGEAMRRREEQAATDNIFEGLQSRGIARSGIALRDVVNQVLGPSAERANSLAAQFGLAQAQDRTDFLNQQRDQANQLNQAKLQGRLSSILGYDTGGTQLAQSQLQESAADRRANQANKTARKNAILGGIGGVIGSIFGK